MKKYNVGDIVRLKTSGSSIAKIQGNIGDAYCLTYGGEDHDENIYSWVSIKALNTKYEIIRKAVVIDATLIGNACYKDMKTGKLVIVSGGKNVPYCDGCVINVRDGYVETVSGVHKERGDVYTYKFNEVEVI